MAATGEEREAEGLSGCSPRNVYHVSGQGECRLARLPQDVKRGGSLNRRHFGWDDKGVGRCFRPDWLPFERTADPSTTLRSGRDDNSYLERGC